MTALTIENMTLPQPLPGKTGWPWFSNSEILPGNMLASLSLPKISVVMPSFNQGLFIEEAIRSVLLQAYPHVEFIIIDGGSTDNTLDVIKKYEPWLTTWVSEPDRGQGHAINKGIQKATGEILFWLNSDDMLLSGAFNLISLEFQKSHDVKLVIGQARIIDHNGGFLGELRSYFTNWEELATNPRNSVRQISTFFTRDLFDKYGLVNESLYIAMDNELMVRFTQHVTPIIIQDYLSAYRTHPYAKTSNQLILGYMETDKLRLPSLPTTDLKKTYKQRSSANWLSLVEHYQYSKFTRLKCLLFAFKMMPSVIIKKRFWTATMELFSPQKSTL